MNRRDPQSDNKLVGLSLSYLGSAALGAAARLGVADHLRDRPRTITDLAAATRADHRYLERILRYLASAGIFYEDEHGQFHLTSAAEGLVTETPNSLRDAVSFLTQPVFWEPAGRMTDTVLGGRSVFDDLYGVSFWKYLNGNPEVSAAFAAGMASLSRPEDFAICEAYDFSGSRSVVDVGGGRGDLLQLILRRYHQLTGTLFDQQSAVDHHVLDMPELSGRWSAAAGDFFESIPCGGDVYILKHIILNWDDNESVRLLSRCRDAMSENSCLLIVESLLPPPNTPHYAWALDLMMVNLLTGRERTRDDYDTLLQKADLAITRVIPTATFSSLAVIQAAVAK